MAVPKKRTSRARRDKRRAHHALDGVSIRSRVESCPSCGELKQHHHVCPACGQYRGNQIGPAASNE